MIGLRFSILGDEQYARSFDVLASETTHLRTPLGDVSKLLTRTVGEQFLTEGSHGLGGRWHELNRDYQAWKDEHYPGRPMLVLSAAMRQAFLVEGERELTDSYLRWGVDTQTDPETGEKIADRARAHQAGEGHQPQRKIVALRQDDRRAMDRIFVAWFNAVRRSILPGGPR